jgi:hypothetical protein
MMRRFALFGLSSMSVFLALDFAQADQIYPSTSQSDAYTSCQFGDAGVRCTHFEGYVVVRRHETAIAPSSDAKADGALSANRLYLPANEDKTP